MPVVQVILNPRDYEEIRKVKARHGHTWVDCVKIYADIYSQVEPKPKKSKAEGKPGLREL